MRVLVSLALVLFANVASGSPILLPEPPDRPPSNGPTYILEAGSNVVSGSVFGAPGIGDDADSFSITVPLHLVVTSTTLAVTGFNNGGGTPATLGCFTGAGCFGSAMFSGLSNPGTGSTVSYTATAPWSEYGGGIASGGFTYALTFEVEPLSGTVPEPGTLLLIAPALAWLGLRRRRA